MLRHGFMETAMRSTLIGLVIRLLVSPRLRYVAWLGLAALALASLIPAEHSPPRTRLPASVEHFIAYACVSALTALAFRRAVRIRLLAGGLIGYSAVLEYSQRWSPGRSASMVDFLSSSAGVLVGIGACVLLLRGLSRLNQAPGG
jgi:VanZ family protein